MTAPQRVALGVVLLLALGAHGLQKWLAGVSLQEMVWGCHLATLVLALGLLANVERLTVIGLVFHVGVGAPAWVIEVATNGTTATSTAAHVLPLVAGTLALRGRTLPWAAGAWTLGFFVATQLAALPTDPSLNVNVMFRSYGGGATPSLALLRLGNVALAAVCIALGLVVLRLALPRLRPDTAKAAAP